MTKIDRKIIQAIKRGDTKSFEQLYWLYKDKLYFFTLRYTKSRELTEEIVQEVFIKIWSQREKLDHHLNFDHFIFKIAKHHLLNCIKSELTRQKYQHDAISLKPDYQENTEHTVIYQDLLKVANQAVNNLSERRKLIFRMNRNDGLTYREIAQKLDISVNTVEVQMCKALHTIRQHLRSEGDMKI